MVGAFAFKDSFSDQDLGIAIVSAVPRVVSAGIGSSTAALFVAVDDEFVWWLTGREPELVNPVLYRAPLDENADGEAVLEVGEPGGLFVDDDFVYWTELDSNPNDRGRVLRLRKPL